MDKQINHDDLHDESKSRTHRLSKLPDDGDPWAPNNLLLATDKKLRSQPTKMNSFMSGQSKSLTPHPPACNLSRQHNYQP